MHAGFLVGFGVDVLEGVGGSLFVLCGVGCGMCHAKYANRTMMSQHRIDSSWISSRKQVFAGRRFGDVPDGVVHGIVCVVPRTTLSNWWTLGTHHNRVNFECYQNAGYRYACLMYVGIYT